MGIMYHMYRKRKLRKGSTIQYHKVINEEWLLTITAFELQVLTPLYYIAPDTR